MLANIKSVVVMPVTCWKKLKFTSANPPLPIWKPNPEDTELLDLSSVEDIPNPGALLTKPIIFRVIRDT